MNRKKRITSRVLSEEEANALFSPKALDRLAESVETMGPFEPDPSRLTPEREATLDRLVDGYCASGHDPNYWSSEIARSCLESDAADVVETDVENR
jgi:hypothetical protein